ncbi:MAG TPA: DUF268 domain-containing protein [Flavisolibacter sp.]|nr:DUF268 domain-containing protein [Flavisolibacter sp.]
MKQFVKRYLPFLIPLRYASTFVRRPDFFGDFFKYRKQTTGTNKPLFKDIFPFVQDKTGDTLFDTHYIYHPAWATRIVKEINPAKHIDISSTLHFSTQLSAFIPTEFYDYRPAHVKLSGLKSGAADLCRLHFPDDSIESLSCMHTVEHIGLGRYGDPIDPRGDLSAIKELQRVLKPGGNFLFVTPVGKPRVQFNAHRVYSYEQITGLFNQLKLVEFSLIPDNALEVGMIKNADPGLVKEQIYGCGCFWFTK